MRKVVIALAFANSVCAGVAYAQMPKQACKMECARIHQDCARAAADAAAKKECFQAWKTCNGNCG